SGRADRRQAGETAPEFGDLDRGGALQRALRRVYNFTGDFGRKLVGAKLLQAGVDHHRQVALLVLLGEADRLVNLLALERRRDFTGGFALLVPGRAASQLARDHEPTVP